MFDPKMEWQPRQRSFATQAVRSYVCCDVCGQNVGGAAVIEASPALTGVELPKEAEGLRFCSQKHMLYKREQLLK